MDVWAQTCASSLPSKQGKGFGGKLAEGGQAFIQKPFTLTSLLAKIREALA